MTRGHLLLKAKPSIRADHLVKELDWLFRLHVKPKKIRFNNGPEFRSRLVTKFLDAQGTQAGFIEPGSPWQNGHIESSFGKLRDDLLKMDIFPTGKDLQRHLDDFQEHYNPKRPRAALGGMTPAKYKESIKIEKEEGTLKL